MTDPSSPNATSRNEARRRRQRRRLTIITVAVVVVLVVAAAGAFLATSSSDDSTEGSDAGAVDARAPAGDRPAASPRRSPPRRCRAATTKGGDIAVYPRTE